MGTTSMTFQKKIINWQGPQNISKCSILVKNKKQRAIEQFLLVSTVGQVKGQDISNMFTIGNLAPASRDPSKTILNQNYKSQELVVNFPILTCLLNDKLVIVKPTLYISFDGWTKERNYACKMGNIQYCEDITFEIYHKNQVLMITQKQSRKLEMLEASKVFGIQYQEIKQACNKIFSKFNK